jgi:uncharacterized membrane protein
MFKTTYERIKRNLLFIFFIFMLGNIFGSGIASFSIAEDCAVMQKFRIARIAYSCQRLAP